MADSKSKVASINAYGNITKVLNKIISASTPDRFTVDFLSTKLGLSGGSATPLIPFLKRSGFLNTDGSPSDLYKQFRNQASRGKATAQALKIGFAPLYEINEYAHEADDAKLKGIVLQATGLDEKSSGVRAIIGSFKALKEFASFEDGGDDLGDVDEDVAKNEGPAKQKTLTRVNAGAIKLGYTINLNLPPTSDIAVFNAIFKSLKEHLLEDE